VESEIPNIKCQIPNIKCQIPNIESQIPYLGSHIHIQKIPKSLKMGFKHAQTVIETHVEYFWCILIDYKGPVSSFIIAHTFWPLLGGSG